MIESGETSPIPTTDASDAGSEIAVALAERFAPWPEAAVVDTARTPDEATDQADRIADAVAA